MRRSIYRRVLLWDLLVLILNFDIYWKAEHRLMCTSDVCTAAERDRYEKTTYKAQRNVILCISACLLYWSIYRICKFQKDIQSMEEVEKRIKSK
ncbi:B-cell receptor-associated-like protein [Medicago truncatula]|uniref:Endoplasmic reticulum transmembrane protein n=1 Tax=Medicago truncatula TaxID=3880 RepID=A0A072UPX8_MEDTR|nr:B-cell receptor-associated-like protein [Medicago truncatula]